MYKDFGLHSRGDTHLSGVRLGEYSQQKWPLGWTLTVIIGLGTVACACNPSTLGGRGGWITKSRDRDHPGQHGETPSLLKIQKISWAWWRVPVVPATQEAEARELPEPRRRRLWWAEMAPLHSSLGDMSETPSQKKKKIIIDGENSIVEDSEEWNMC